jgi:hypothetical protein
MVIAKLAGLLVIAAIFLQLCESCDSDESSLSGVTDNLTAVARQRTSAVEATQTEAPRATWTAEANATLTQVPVNEARTRAAMDATLTAEAQATDALFTREAQTVSANRTATARALTSTSTPTVTPTATDTLTPTATPSPTISPTPAPTDSPTPPVITLLPPTIGNTLVSNLPLDQIFAGATFQNPRANVTDPTGIYLPEWADFLKQSGSTFLLNTWGSSDLVLTVASNRFDSAEDANAWNELTNAPGSGSAAEDVTIEVNGGEGLDEIRCKKGTRTANGRSYNTGYCDSFLNNVHVGFNFATPLDIDEVMQTRGATLLNVISATLQ